MDRSRKPTDKDKGKGIARSESRSRSVSPEKDPRHEEGYMGGDGTPDSSPKQNSPFDNLSQDPNYRLLVETEGTSGSRPKRNSPFGTLDILPRLNQEDIAQFASWADPDFELHQALNKTLMEYEAGKGKQPLSNTGNTSEKLEKEDIEKTIKLSKEEADRKYNEDMEEAIIRSRYPSASKEDIIFAIKAEQQIKGAGPSHEQVPSETQGKFEDYGNFSSGSEVSQPGSDED